MRTIAILLIGVFACPFFIEAQNIGIGNPAPVEKLDVAGNVKASGMIITSGGTAFDFLMKGNPNGNVGFRKGHGAVAIRYIICLQGIYPSPDFGLTGEPFLAEIKMFAGIFAPNGWAFCDGQLLPINQNTALFSLIGTLYGGNGTTNFALPDMRGAAPLGTGTSPAGYSWLQGVKSN